MPNSRPGIAPVVEVCAACPNALEFRHGVCSRCGTVWFKGQDGTMQILGNAAEMDEQRRWMQSLSDDDYVEAKRLRMFEPDAPWRGYARQLLARRSESLDV